MFMEGDKAMKSRRPKFAIILASTASIVGMALLVWSLLYQYSAVKGDVFRVNRLSGVRQKATAKGWRTEEQIVTEKFIEDERVNRQTDAMMEPERMLARQALATVSIDEKRSTFFVLWTYNPSEFMFAPSASFKMAVEYFSLDANGVETWLCKEMPEMSAVFGAKDHDITFLSDNYVRPSVPAEVGVLPAKTNIIQRITVEFDSARGTYNPSHGISGLGITHFFPPLKRTFERSFQTK